MITEVEVCTRNEFGAESKRAKAFSSQSAKAIHSFPIFRVTIDRHHPAQVFQCAGQLAVKKALERSYIKHRQQREAAAGKVNSFEEADLPSGGCQASAPIAASTHVQTLQDGLDRLQLVLQSR